MSSLWQYMWKIEILPKVKNFIWRTLSNILPINSRLSKCGIKVNTTYPRCDHEETVQHVLRDCFKARRCWEIGLPVQTMQTSGIFEWGKQIVTERFKRGGVLLHVETVVRKE